MGIWNLSKSCHVVHLVGSPQVFASATAAVASCQMYLFACAPAHYSSLHTLELFSVNGVLGTHLDVDVWADQAGVAQVRVASPLIPKLPFKNPTASVPLSGSGKQQSEWFIVTNMGSGESYYYNDQTGDTTFQKPKGF